MPDQTVELFDAGFVGVRNKQTGDTFALMSLDPPTKCELVVHAHAATIRLLYPQFMEANQPSIYRAAYFFGKATRQEIEGLHSRLKAGS